MFQRIPLTIKMLVVTVAVGIGVSIILDYFQSKRLKNIFYAQLSENLDKHASEDRRRFDRYVDSYNKAARLIISQKRFLDYIGQKYFYTGKALQIKSLEEVPSWLPEPSVLRSLINVRYALLSDSEGNVREAYQNWPDAPPQSLLYPSALLKKLSHGQSLMTKIDNIPFLITAESVSDSQGRTRATLMLASPIDSEFLIASQESAFHEDVMLLLEGEDMKVVATTQPESIPIGSTFDMFKDRYIVEGKSFFDQGSSELLMQYISVIPKSHVEALSRDVLSRDRQQRVLITFLLIVSFALIMLWVTRNILLLTKNVMGFSQNVLGLQTKEIQKGDELQILQKQFQYLTEKIIESRKAIREKAEELSKSNEMLRLEIAGHKQTEAELKKSEQSYKELTEVLGTALEDVKKREQTLLKSRDAFFNMLEDINEAYKDLQELFLNLVSAMVNSLDAKSPWTKGHSDRVATYAVQIAKELGFEEEDINDIHLAGLLHDIGKIGTYDYLLDKPAKLTEEEFAIVKKHPAQGAEILKDIKQLKNMLPMIRHHHERIDGKGYPDGIKGEEISLSAKIMHVADTFDAIMADRPYRPSPGLEYAISELNRCSGTQFDENVVQAFLKILSRNER
ncbi:MAG: HD-GYP domain-containing protein [Nitrospirae bacterium]|nr:HD-GYP domain-containing protein [Nitrospirota bacterium]